MKSGKITTNMKKILLLSLAILFSPYNMTNSQTIKEIGNLDTFIDTAMSRWNVPGLAVGIIKDGKVIYSKGFGYRDLKTKEKVSEKTLFAIASATKSFTASAAALIVDEKKMGFDTPLRTYFPEFRLYDSAASGKITLRDLLTHRTGIPRQKFFSLNVPENRKDIRTSMRYFEPSLDFRSSWQYCNENYTVAGDMIAERYGSTWEDLIRKRILEPLGMNNTIFSIRELNGNTDYARPYIDWSEIPEEMDYYDSYNYGPAGSIISNIEDLTKWALFNLKQGKVGDIQLINPQRLLQIQSPQMVIPTQPQYSEISYAEYGMGWFIDYYRSKLHIHHGGVLYGFTSKVSFMPGEKIGIVILANLNGTPFVDILERYIMDNLLQLEPVDWQKRYVDLYDKQKKQMQNSSENGKQTEAIQKPPLSLDRYTGNYVSRGYGSIFVRQENDTLKVKIQKYDCPLFFRGNETFELYHPVEHSGWETTFVKDSQENITALSVLVNQNTKPVLFKKKM